MKTTRNALGEILIEGFALDEATYAVVLSGDRVAVYRCAPRTGDRALVPVSTGAWDKALRRLLLTDGDQALADALTDGVRSELERLAKRNREAGFMIRTRAADLTATLTPLDTDEARATVHLAVDRMIELADRVRDEL